MMLNKFNKLAVNLFALLPYLFFTPNLSFGQVVFAPVGASQWMLGGTSVAHSDVWSATNNAGAITEVKRTQGGIYSEQRFNESKLRLSNASFILPTKYCHIGASINYFGYQAFNQQKIGLSIAKKLSNIFSLGVQLNYVATNIENYGNAGNVALAGGLLIKPLPSLTLGFSVFNPTQNEYAEFTTERMPSYARLGCAYDVSDKITLHTEADQTLSQSLIFRGGVKYKLHPIIHLAVGASNKPVYYTFGTSIFLKSIQIDLATSFHQVLGVTPHLGLSLPVQK